MPSSNNVRKVTSENYPTDAGREGEAIFRRVYALAGSKLPIKRLWISSMEDAAIQQGFENLRDGAAYDNLFAASECRAKADWLIGMNGTRAFTKKYGRKQTIGRVQTPTLAMLAERQAKIQNFVKEPYYKVELSGAGVVAVSEQMSQEQDADAMQAACDGQCAVVGSIERKRVEKKPPKLYNLTTLQREANRYYGLTASQTLQAAQELYEEKLVTYPRTDSQFVTEDMRRTVESLVLALDGTAADVSCVINKVTKNNGNRCSAYVPEHHEAIVSPGIARAAHLVASSKKKCGVQDIVVIQQGALKGFVGIHPNWSGISVDSIHSLCLRAYLPEEVAKLNDIAEMRAGTKLEKPLRSEYLTISGTCFINQSSPVITISKNGIRFSKACHTRLDDCEHVELLYHPILQVVILRKSNRDASTAIHWENKDKICSSFSSRAFSGVIFEAMNWKWSCRYQCRGICRGEENAKFLIFELDESRILIRKNQYEQIEDRSMNLKCRLYRSKWVQSITVSDVMESGQVVENPMIGAIPSRNEVQRELDDLLMSM